MKYLTNGDKKKKKKLRRALIKPHFDRFFMLYPSVLAVVTEVNCILSSKGKGTSKVHPCTGTATLYRPYGS
jgi:hypothetical protein